MVKSKLLEYFLKKYVRAGVVGHVGYKLFSIERFFKEYFQLFDWDTWIWKLGEFTDKDTFKQELLSHIEEVITPLIDELWDNPHYREKIARLNKINSSEDDFDFE